jgi:hypothetical protein
MITLTITNKKISAYAGNRVDKKLIFSSIASGSIGLQFIV